MIRETEGRGQTTEDGGQKTENGRRKSEICSASRFPYPLPSSSSVLRSPSSMPTPPFFLGGVLLLMMAIHFSAQWRFSFPLCGLRAMTGIPCPFCGSTRALFAWSNLQITEAFFFNPLTCLALLAVVAWFLIWAGDALLKRQWMSDVCRFFRTRPAKIAIFLLVVLNWIYLCWTLPR